MSWSDSQPPSQGLPPQSSNGWPSSNPTWPGNQPTGPAPWPTSGGTPPTSAWPGSGAPDWPGNQGGAPGGSAQTANSQQTAQREIRPVGTGDVIDVTDDSPGARADAGAPGVRKAPGLWLLVASLLVVASVVSFLLTRGATFGAIGWALGGPLAIGAVALFLVAESKARQDAWYAGSDLLSWGRRVVITLALVAVGLNAYRIAYDLARGMWT